jgi:hypothetical protein
MIPIGVWIGFYIVLSIFLMALQLHLVITNLPYIHKYRITRILTAILVPLLTINVVWFFAEAVLLFQHNDPLLPLILSQIASLLFASVIITLTSILLAYKGKNWIMRRKHGRNNFFGPYLCYGKDPTTSMCIQWGCPKKYQKISKISKEFPKFQLGLSREELKPVKSSLLSNSLIQYILLVE